MSHQFETYLAHRKQKLVYFIYDTNFETVFKKYIEQIKNSNSQYLESYGETELIQYKDNNERERTLTLAGSWEIAELLVFTNKTHFSRFVRLVLNEQGQVEENYYKS